MKNAVWNAEELSSIRNVDRILPSQPYFQKMYKGDDFYGDLQRVINIVSPAELELNTQLAPGMTYAAMGSELNTLRFYQFLIHSHKYKRVLELGTYIGVSAMYMAEAGASVISVEKGREFFEIARENIGKNGYEKTVSLVCADAIRFLKDSYANIVYDFILIDCAKESYKELLELSLLRLSPGGMILVDDVFFQGDTLNDVATSEKGAGVRKMLDYAATLEDWEKVILPIGNGLLMMRRK